MPKANKPISTHKVVLTSLLVNIADVVLNLVVAIFTGSVAVGAQSLQGFADLTTSGLLYIGYRRSKRRANAHYQFGFGREIFFWVLLSGIFMLIFTGGVSFWLGLQRFLNPEPIKNLGAAYAMLLVGIATNGYAFSLSYKRLRQTNRKMGLWYGLINSSLIETKATFLVDAVGSLAALTGLVAISLVGITGNGSFDGVGAMAVGLIMAVFSIVLIRNVKDFIVGRSVNPQIAERICSAALKVDHVQDVLDLRTMYLGSERVLAIIEIHIDERLKTKSIEQLTDEVKQKIRLSVPKVEVVQVEVETPDEEVSSN